MISKLEQKLPFVNWMHIKKLQKQKKVKVTNISRTFNYLNQLKH